MKRKLILVSMLCFQSFFSDAQRIVFTTKNSWAEVQQLAKTTGKAIFLDAYTTWCGPCREMESSVFKDSLLATFVNANLIPLRVQIDSTGSDKPAVKAWYRDARYLSSKFRITAFPTICIISPNDDLIEKSVGLKNAAQLLELTTKSASSANVYVKSLAEFRKGNVEPAFIKSLIDQVTRLDDTEILSEIGNAFFNSLSDKEKFKKDNLEIINYTIQKSSDKGFKFFRQNLERINRLTQPRLAERRIEWIIHLECIRPHTKPGKNPDWNAIYKNVVSRYGLLGEEEVLRSKAFYYLNLNNQVSDHRTFPAVIAYLDKYYLLETDAMQLNNFAWQFFLHRNDKKELNKALSWSNRAIALDPKSGNWKDTNANLLYKLGRSSEAIKMEEAAFTLEPQNNDIKNNLQKMRAGLKTWSAN